MLNIHLRLLGFTYLWNGRALDFTAINLWADVHIRLNFFREIFPFPGVDISRPPKQNDLDGLWARWGVVS